MPLHKAGTGHDGQGHLVESFQQLLGGGLARTPSRDLQMLLCQRGTHHTREDGHDPQSDGQQADETYPMISALHIQRRKTTEGDL
jgi:hypothetical protein